MPHTYDYERPSFAADNIIYKDNKILVIKRKKWPFEGMWALPGGFVNPKEVSRDAAVRELQEETGLTDITAEFVGIFEGAERDPRGWVISAAYMADVTGRDVRPVAADDAADVMWIPADTTMQLAFDHNVILTKANWLRAVR